MQLQASSLLGSDGLGRFPVLCVSNGFQTHYERGFCNALVARGAQVTLISSDATDVERLSPLIRTKNLRGSQDPKRPKWKKLLNMIRYHLSLLALAPASRGSIVHMIGNADPPLLCGVLEGAWFRLWAKKYVLTVHDLLPHGGHTDFNRFIHRLVYRLPHVLVAHTERTKSSLSKDFGISPSRIVVMAHGLEPLPIGKPVQVTVHEPGSTVQILMFGVTAPYKGIDLLLDSLQRVSFPFELLIAGFCVNDEYRTQLRELIAAFPEPQRIRWRDAFIPDHEMAAMFDQADFLALPYRRIDQSGVLFQALRFGLPVVATRVGAFEDYVSEEVGELAAAGDLADLARACEDLVRRRGSISRERIRKIGRGYEWSATIGALKLAYSI